MEEEERMWMMAAAAGFSGTLILGLLLYRERLKGKRLVERKKELEEDLRKAENEAERMKETETRLSKRVSELEKSLEDKRREREEICGAAANVHLYAQLGGEKAASRELKGILQVIAKESRKIAEKDGCMNQPFIRRAVIEWEKIGQDSYLRRDPGAGGPGGSGI